MFSVLGRQYDQELHKGNRVNESCIYQQDSYPICKCHPSDLFYTYVTRKHLVTNQQGFSYEKMSVFFPDNSFKSMEMEHRYKKFVNRFFCQKFKILKILKNLKKSFRERVEEKAII
jgi:hypothetical protein